MPTVGLPGTGQLHSWLFLGVPPLLPAVEGLSIVIPALNFLGLVQTDLRKITAHGCRCSSLRVHHGSSQLLLGGKPHLAHCRSAVPGDR